MHNQNPVSKDRDNTGAQHFIGPRLPPIPARLVEKIQSGQFVELAELLPDHIGSLSDNLALDNESKTSSKQSKRQVSTILEWVRCFSLYMAVIALKYPARLPDLLGYQVLIVETTMEHEGDGWLGYDRRFRQMAVALPHTTIPSLVQPSSQPFQAQQSSGFSQGYSNHSSGFQHFQPY